MSPGPCRTKPKACEGWQSWKHHDTQGWESIAITLEWFYRIMRFACEVRRDQLMQRPRDLPIESKPDTSA